MFKTGATVQNKLVEYNMFSDINTIHYPHNNYHTPQLTVKTF